MSLERRAEQAVRSLKASLSEVSPVDVPAIGRRHRIAWAGGMAVLAMVVGLSFAFARLIPSEETPPDLADPSIPTSIPDTTSTVPDEPTPGLIPGDPSPSTTSPSGTTTPGTPTTEPSEATTTTSTTEPGPAPIAATATQPTGSSSSASPSGSYAGTAPPGTVVTASSDYGSASTMVGPSGDWTLTVPFEGMPIGEAFPVTVNVGSRSFSFTFRWSYVPPATATQALGSSDAADPFERFSGTAPPGTTVTASSPHGSASATADAHGRWSLQLDFSDLPTGASFPIAVHVGGAEFEFTFDWTYVPPTTADQLIGSSDEPEPFDQFSGTAPEGTPIRIESIYGSASGAADANDEWFVEVRFTDAPPWEHFEEFPVTVYVGDDRYDFSFTWTYHPEATAEQHFGSSIEASPFERFTGLAPPGTTVTATSEYGSESTVASAGSGEWTLEVFFTGQPANESFTITVTAGGETFTFSFIWEPVEDEPPASTTTSTTTSSTTTTVPSA